MDTLADNVTFLNSSVAPVARRTDSSYTMYLSLAFVTTPGLVINAFSLYLIIRDIKKAMFPAILLLCVLCVVDFTAVICSAVNHIVKRYVTDVNLAMCASLSVLQVFFRIFAGALNMLMAFDRAMAICMPFYYRRCIDVKTWKIACFVAAVSTFVFTLFPLMGLGSIMDTTIKNGVATYRCTSLGYQSDPLRQVYGIIYGIYGYVVVVTVVICNTLVIRSILILNKRVVNLPSNEPSSTVDSNDVRSAKNVTSFEIVFAKLMGGLAAVYIVCGTPYSTLVLMTQANLNVSPIVIGVIHFLAGMAYTVDPIVYILIRKANRRRIFNMVCKCKSDDDS